MDVVIRRALPSDAPALTRVAHAAKRHWKYPDGWIRLWRDALTVTPGFVERHPVWCAFRGASLAGFYALSGEGATRELEHLWVLPAHVGRGVGAQLLAHAVAMLREEGARVLRIASDPYAEGFYLAMGARRVGEVASAPRGRTLPLLVIEVSGRSAYPI
ncbi:MAG: GNAT family N-acetyltransferase [candidate division NC10 bacterium]